MISKTTYMEYLSYISLIYIIRYVMLVIDIHSRYQSEIEGDPFSPRVR
jgi:hypothetical protein